MYCMKIFQIGEKYLSFNGEEFTSSVEVRDGLSLSDKPNVANPALTVPLRGTGTTVLLSVRPIAVRKSKRVNDSWFLKKDNENEMSLVALSTSVVYQKSLRYSTYIAEGSLNLTLEEGVSKHCGVPEDVDSEDMIVAETRFPILSIPNSATNLVKLGSARGLVKYQLVAIQWVQSEA
ncbi:hypothetical protein Tco_0530398 [Tanacetum coccineum]